jgi:hypothetical protein
MRGGGFHSGVVRPAVERFCVGQVQPCKVQPSWSCRYRVHKATSSEPTWGCIRIIQRKALGRVFGTIMLARWNLQLFFSSSSLTLKKQLINISDLFLHGRKGLEPRLYKSNTVGRLHGLQTKQ